jgi:secreted trypsin-like serine protease
LKKFNLTQKNKNKKNFQAAHCVVRFSQVDVYLGITDRNLGLAGFGQDRIDRSHIFAHQDFNPAMLYNDIALIYLSTASPALLADPDVGLINLPSRSEESNTFEDVRATVSGFGKTSDNSDASMVLNFVSMPIMANRECARSFRDYIIESSLCTSTVGRRSSCSGDSGCFI